MYMYNLFILVHIKQVYIIYIYDTYVSLFVHALVNRLAPGTPRLGILLNSFLVHETRELD